MIKKILLYALLAVVLFIGVVGINLFLFTRKSSVVSTGTPITPRENGKAALFVIDLQGTTTGAVSQSQDYKGMSEWLIPRVNRLSEQADSLGLPVIYIVNVVTNPLVNLLNNSMAPGTDGAKPDERLNIRDHHHLITKSREDAFTNPELDRLLEQLGVDHLYLTGLDAAHCVRGTFLGALNREYGITLIRDAILASPDSLLEVTLTELAGKGAKIIFSEVFPQDATFSAGSNL